MSEFKPLIAKAADGRPRSAEEAKRAFDIMMSGEATPAQIGGFLMALRVRGEAVSEITGAGMALGGRELRGAGAARGGGGGGGPRGGGGGGGGEGSGWRRRPGRGTPSGRGRCFWQLQHLDLR